MASGSNQNLYNSCLYCGPHPEHLISHLESLKMNQSRRDHFTKMVWYFTSLDYNESNDCVYCYICRLYLSKKMLKLPQKDLSSLLILYLLTERIEQLVLEFMKNINLYINAVEDMMVTHSNTALDIGRMLSANYEEERNINREMLLWYWRTSRPFLRGDEDEVNRNLFNYYNLMIRISKSIIGWRRKVINILIQTSRMKY